MQLNIDEILAKLAERRDHGPHDLHELVYQLARIVKNQQEPSSGDTHGSTVRCSAAGCLAKKGKNKIGLWLCPEHAK